VAAISRIVAFQLILVLNKTLIDLKTGPVCEMLLINGMQIMGTFELKLPPVLNA